MYRPSITLTEDNWFCYAKRGNDWRIERYLNARFNVNTRDGRGNTALHYAAANDCRTTMLILLERGANPGIRNNQGLCPLEFARVNGAARVTLSYLKTLEDNWVANRPPIR